MHKMMLTAFIALCCLASCCHALGHAAEFNSSWTPKPLVDNHQSSLSKRTEPKPAAQPDVEAMLKPAEPFIASVEKQLYIQSGRKTTLIQRLNHLQNVLFGGPHYEDAGQLLSALAELFPAEAARAHAELSAQLQRSSSSWRVSSNPLAVERAQKSHIAGSYAGQLAPISEIAQNKKPFWRQSFDKRNDDWVMLKNDSFLHNHPSDVFVPRQALSNSRGK
jgi:hypothetical protein